MALVLLIASGMPSANHVKIWGAFGLPMIQVLKLFVFARIARENLTLQFVVDNVDASDAISIVANIALFAFLKGSFASRARFVTACLVPFAFACHDDSSFLPLPAIKAGIRIGWEVLLDIVGGGNAPRVAPFVFDDEVIQSRPDRNRNLLENLIFLFGERRSDFAGIARRKRTTTDNRLNERAVWIVHRKTQGLLMDGITFFEALLIVAYKLLIAIVAPNTMQTIL